MLGVTVTECTVGGVLTVIDAEAERVVSATDTAVMTANPLANAVT
jgi:hypothetical protein